MVTPRADGGDWFNHVPTDDDVESVIAAPPLAPKPTPTQMVEVQAEDSTFSMPSDDGRSLDFQFVPDSTFVAAVVPPAVPCPVTRHWNDPSLGQTRAPSVTVESA